MPIELEGGVLVDPRPPEEKIAGLEDLNKLPIGPTLPISQPTKKTLSGESVEIAPPEELRGKAI